MAHVAGVGFELFDDRRDDDHVDRVVHARHLDEGRVDGVAAFERVGHLVGEEHELGVGQVLEIDHLPVVVQRFAHGLALFVVPLLLLCAAGECRGEERQHGHDEENFFMFG